MVWMKVCHHHRCQVLPGQGSGEDRSPCRSTGFGAKTRVEHRPSIVIPNEVDVDVVEAIRQRQSKPIDPISDRDQFSGARRMCVGKYQWRNGGGLLHRRSLPGGVLGGEAKWGALRRGDLQQAGATSARVAEPPDTANAARTPAAERKPTDRHCCFGG